MQAYNQRQEAAGDMCERETKRQLSDPILISTNDLCWPMQVDSKLTETVTN